MRLKLYLLTAACSFAMLRFCASMGVWLTCVLCLREDWSLNPGRRPNRTRHSAASGSPPLQHLLNCCVSMMLYGDGGATRPLPNDGGA